jgi:redox-sensitive bicupin YhaK (pirin superfamily)
MVDMSTIRGVTMIYIRKAMERGHADYGWLNTWHTFSFNTYHDPTHMGFRSLPVINEDRVQPEQGFGTHGHRDMEIISYVLEGTLEHRDSLANSYIIHPGELQRMSAGTGVQHSEFNPSQREPVHFYQTWLLPAQKGLTPSYEQRTFSDEEKRGAFRLVASPDGRNDSLTIHQDARVFLASLNAGQGVSWELPVTRHAWMQVLKGTVELANQSATTGDGVAVSEEKALVIRASEPSELMLFDLA